MRNQAFFSPHRLFLFLFFFVSVALAWTQTDRQTDIHAGTLKHQICSAQHHKGLCCFFLVPTVVHVVLSSSSPTGSTEAVPLFPEVSFQSFLETHCLSLPHWEIYDLGFFFFFFWVFTFPAGSTSVPKSLIWTYLKWTMFALIVGKFTDKHRRQFAWVQTWQEQEERWGGENPSPCGPTLPNIEAKANYVSRNRLDGCECLMDTWIKNNLEVQLWLF